VNCYLGQTPALGCVGGNPVTGAGGRQDLSGTRLPLTPKYSGTLSGEYELSLGGLPFNGFVRADYSWRSEVQYSLTNAPQNIEDEYGLLGATVGVRAKDGRYSLSVYGKNLTDEFHVGGLGILGGGFGTITQQIGPDYQRIWGATFDYNF